MEPLIVAAFLLVLGIALYKMIQIRRRTPALTTHLEAIAGLWKAFVKLLGNGKELALFATFQLAAISALALSLAAFGPQVSIIALLVCVALLLLFTLKPPPKAN
jgi:hypothetical protein